MAVSSRAQPPRTRMTPETAVAADLIALVMGKVREIGGVAQDGTEGSGGEDIDEQRD